jgi:hypothetical protein
MMDVARDVQILFAVSTILVRKAYRYLSTRRFVSLNELMSAQFLLAWVHVLEVLRHDGLARVEKRMSCNDAREAVFQGLGEILICCA